jgi:hypothetical protein
VEWLSYSWLSQSFSFIFGVRSGAKRSGALTYLDNTVVSFLMLTWFLQDYLIFFFFSAERSGAISISVSGDFKKWVDYGF